MQATASEPHPPLNSPEPTDFAANPQPYSWAVLYDDGRVLIENRPTEDDGSPAEACTFTTEGNPHTTGHHAWLCVDKQRISKLYWLTAADVILPPETDGGGGNQGQMVVTQINIHEGQQAILFRRWIHSDALNSEGNPDGPPPRVAIPVIGWQQNNKVTGKTEKMMLAIMPDGRVIATDRDSDLEL